MFDKLKPPDATNIRKKNLLGKTVQHNLINSISSKYDVKSSQHWQKYDYTYHAHFLLFPMDLIHVTMR